MAINMKLIFAVVLISISLLGCSSTNKPGDIFHKKIYTEKNGDSPPLYRAEGKFKGNDVYIKSRNSLILDEGIFALIVDPNTNVIVQTLSYEEYTDNVYKPVQKNPSMQSKKPVNADKMQKYKQLVERAKKYDISTSTIGIGSSLKSAYYCVPENALTDEIVNACTIEANNLINQRNRITQSMNDLYNQKEAHLSSGKISILLQSPGAECVATDSQGICRVRDTNSTIWTAVIKNNTQKITKDYTISCKIMANSGTVLSNQTSKVYEILQPNERKNIKFQLYSVEQMKSTSCEITNWVNVN